VRILFVCHELPIPSYAGTLRVLNSLKYLAEKHGHAVTLIGFRLPGKNYPDLSRYGRVEPVDIPAWPGLQSPRAALKAVRNILRGHLSLLNFAYSAEMARRVKALLGGGNFDIMVVDHPTMLVYAPGGKIPVVLLEAFELSEIALMEYKNEKNPLFKAIRWLYYRRMRGRERIYQAATVSIAVSSWQGDTVRSYCPGLNIAVIPFGVETDYFQPVEPETEFPSLIITGSFSRTANRRMVRHFYQNIYPLIKTKVPGVKLFIVGSNPGKDILKLTSDESVVVTGYVDDLRPYLSRAWVVLAPLQEGFGVKVRVLQAMAMGKPVVATSMVARGIEVRAGRNIVLADGPEEFAGKVIELLNDRPLREELGIRARQLMETEHSWEDLTGRLNEVLEKAVKKATISSGGHGHGE
jgi:glycosyltransferase involved in cell wall biosynthesis